MKVNVGYVTETVMRPVKTKVPTYNLNINADEARLIFHLLGSIVGGSKLRALADHMWDALEKSGLESYAALDITDPLGCKVISIENDIKDLVVPED